MHDCPDCESACDCDMEDHYQSAPDDCSHECEQEDYNALQVKVEFPSGAPIVVAAPVKTAPPLEDGLLEEARQTINTLLLTQAARLKGRGNG